MQNQPQTGVLLEHVSSQPQMDSHRNPVLDAGEMATHTAGSVGVYDGTCRLRTSGTLYLTPFRLIWISTAGSDQHALAIRICQIRKVLSQSAFLTSSAKIALHVSKLPLVVPLTETTWNCDVCRTFNVGMSLKCAKCGFMLTTKMACPECTFVNIGNCKTCEICNKSLGYPNEDETVGDSSNLALVKFSFRAGGLPDLLAALNSSIISKSWATTTLPKSLETSFVVNYKIGGIGAVVNSLDTSNTKINSTLDEAFVDLENLMLKITEIVQLAKVIEKRMDSNEASTQERSDFQRCIKEIGILQPVTKNAITDVSFHKELAQELCGFLAALFEKNKTNMMTLCDIYCFFNRARGVSLISPQDLYQSCLICNSLQIGFELYEFDSGLKVMRSSLYSDKAFLLKLADLLKHTPKMTFLGLSQIMGTSIGISKAQLLVFEDLL